MNKINLNKHKWKTNKHKHRNIESNTMRVLEMIETFKEIEEALSRHYAGKIEEKRANNLCKTKQNMNEWTTTKQTWIR